VRPTRPALKDAPDDEPALRGDIYLTDEAIGKGLIDARATLTEAILEASRLGREYADIQRAKSQLLSII
ncbi:peptidase, partial [Phocaeicola vulgatus]|nr:peptidase [Phocaeicola vulgatus]